MKIGITSDAYPNRRNINNKTGNRYVRINRLNLNAYLNVLANLLGRRLGSVITERFITEGYRGVFFQSSVFSLAHLFNTVSFSKHPWMATFETTVPFFRREIEAYLSAGMGISAVKNRRKLDKGLRACASDSCKALIALSQCSMDIQLGLISNFPELEPAIKRKLIQIYPPQNLVVRSIEEKDASTHGKLKFMFVGREFYRKGGLETLRCFERLSVSHEFELIVVSRLENDIPDLIPERHELEARAIIERHQGTWLRYHKELDNTAVIDLMKSAHVGLLPTYSDTFGFSVLEFQASGCPVISTDVRALPEINDDESGWVIRTGVKTPHREIRDIQGVMDSGLINLALEKIVVRIFANPESIRAKGEASIARVAKHHSPADFSAKLSDLYQRSLTVPD